MSFPSHKDLSDGQYMSQQSDYSDSDSILSSVSSQGYSDHLITHPQAKNNNQNIFPVSLRNQLISGGLEPVLSHTKKLLYYIQLSTNIKIKIQTIF